MADSPSLVQRVSDAISQWRSGQIPDARGFLAQHPEVKAAGNLVVDLAYEEFCLRQEAGERVDTEKFLGCFPTVQHSLARMLDVHGVMRSQALKIGVETQWPEAGTRWLDWDLVEPLGRGAFSRVFVAREPALGNREVVVKCSFAGPHEAFILGSLSHPNIVPVHSSRHDEVLGLTGISMPLLGRSTLADALNHLVAEGNAARSPELFRQIAGGVPPVRSAGRGTDYACAAVALLQRMAQGLAAAHAVGVVHGDLKPSNILLSFAGEPMLMDFNLSAGPGGDFERAGGTPPYMAPECLADFWRQPARSDEMRKLDPRSDLFSLGVVLLELLLGRIPLRFDLNNPASLPVEEDWRALVSRAASESHEPKLQSILERCLAFDPARRYASAAQLAHDLGAILRAKERRRRWTRRLAMAATASVAIGILVSFGALNREDPDSRPALLRRAKACIDKGEFQNAAMLLTQLQSQGPDARLAAWSGYCFAQIAHYSSAKASYLAAMESVDDASLQNNLGFCYAKLRQNADAEQHFERALHFAPGLQAVYHNRANMRRDTVTSAGLLLPLTAWSDYKQAAMIGPPNGELFLDTSRAIAYAHEINQSLEGDLQEQVRGALAAGIGRQPFTTSRFEHERLDLNELERQAKNLKGPPIPLSARLLLPPPFPLPDR